MNKKLSVPILEVARFNHLAWRDKVKDYFLGLTQSDPEFVNHTQCKLGKWLHGPESTHFKELTIFKELTEVHQTMHETVPVIVEAKKARNIKLYESEFRTFVALADLVVARIEILDMEIQKLEFSESLMLARRFQNGICAEQDNLSSLFKFQGKIDRPLNIVSGDMLWSSYQAESHFIVLIDAVGHGISASMLTTTLATILLGTFSINHETDLMHFQQTVDKFFFQNFKKIVEKEKISFDFTMLKINPSKSNIEVLSNNNRLISLKSDKWGYIQLENSGSFKTACFNYEPGQQIAIYTDGLKDLLIEESKKLGDKGILNFLDDYAGLNAVKLTEHFSKFIDSHIQEFGQLDDILFFCGQL
ncbi:MAG: CZB domain-containing protein [Bacteroidia bacterium]|nr:CZB domain-containing protein [Bacteroidia bacterium]